VISNSNCSSQGNGIILNVSVVAIRVERIRGAVNEGFVLMFIHSNFHNLVSSPRIVVATVFLPRPVVISNLVNECQIKYISKYTNSPLDSNVPSRLMMEMAIYTEFTGSAKKLG
jgi:hypothetical protein